MNSYFLLAAAWVATCVLIGLYIASNRISGKTQVKIGLGAILVTFTAGLVILYIAITHP